MYRMRELERVTNTPRTTIHYYLREGLINPPEKTARNAALYTEEQRNRIEVIRRLRSGPHPAPLAVVRRALDLIDKGVDVDTALQLERAVVDEQATAGGDRELNRLELARSADVDVTFIEQLEDAGVLLGVPGRERPYDGADLAVVRRLGGLREASGVEPEQLAGIAAALRAAIRLEMELRDRLVERMTMNDAANVSRAGQLFVNVWHSYLTSRSRLHEIDRRGLGVDETKGNEP